MPMEIGGHYEYLLGLEAKYAYKELSFIASLKGSKKVVSSSPSIFITLVQVGLSV